ncbi:DUF4040 family protein [Pseudactinotalea sp. Z1748]|uniref:DUF4040 family protein n=1 Tax=Pseudactinotalea sp. Z1748 TaxID=3413027 RepID=UPI003C7CE03F
MRTHNEPSEVLVLVTILAGAALLALVAPFAGRALGAGAGWLLGAGLAGLSAAVAALAPQVFGGSPVVQTVPWMPTLDVHLMLRLDGLSLVFALLVLGIGAIVLAYSARYLGRGPHAGFYGWMSAFAAAMLALVLADDVVVMFVAWEITTLCSFFLIARSGPSAREPAIRTLLVTVAGGLSLLAAVVVMVVATGTTRLSAILADGIWAEHGVLTTTVLVLVVLAAFTKSAQFPFHAWLPDAMAAITPVSAYLHAAAMVKAGIYLLLRFSAAFAQVPIWNVLLISAGLTTAVLGAVVALRQHDLKELAAYSTVSQLGLLVAVIGVGTREAMVAGVVHTVAHALFKGSLFMLIGVVDRQAGSRDLRRIGGVVRAMPLTAVALVATVASMAGIPPLLGFVSKENLYEAFLSVEGPWGPVLAGVAVVASVFTVAYSGRILWGLLARPASPASRSDSVAAAANDAAAPAGSAGGAEPRSERKPREAAVPFWLMAALPGLAGLVLGVAPFLLDTLVATAAGAAAGTGIEVDLALWHGLNVALVLSAIAVGFGAVAIRARGRIDVIMRARSFPFSALGVVDATRRGIISLGVRAGAPTASNAPARHLAVPMVMIVLIAVVGLARFAGLPQVVGVRSQPLDWLLVILILGGVVGAVLAPTRVGAIVVTGVVGFSTTLWYYVLGAADVALTQLLVEILTVLVMVLVLRRLPERFRPASSRRRVGAGALALAAGAATTVGVLALTGRRPLSPAGEFYLGQGEDLSGGQNVVNTILVDFRALDTLGELTVLGVAGVTVAAILAARDPLATQRSDPPLRHGGGLADSAHNTIFIRTLQKWVGPAVVVLSVLFLVRGHNLPGGGFISALIGGAGFGLSYLAAPRDKQFRLPSMALIGSGVLVGTGIGLVGLADGSFLRPLHAYLFDVHLTTALVFDVGVYLAVIGVVLASINLLGSESPPTRASEPTTGPQDPPRGAAMEPGSAVATGSARSGRPEAGNGGEPAPVAAGEVDRS